MFNLKKQSESHYPVNINGKEYALNEQEIGKLIKERLKKSPTIQSLFEDFEVGLDQLDTLNIIITPLDSKYAETDLTTMKLNPMLFDDGNFLEKYFFVVVHDLVHWLTRMKEKTTHLPFGGWNKYTNWAEKRSNEIPDGAYLEDGEEILGNTVSIAYELEKTGNDIDAVWNKLFDKINKWHFHNESDAKDLFADSLFIAQNMIL